MKSQNKNWRIIAKTKSRLGEKMWQIINEKEFCIDTVYKEDLERLGIIKKGLLILEPLIKLKVKR